MILDSLVSSTSVSSSKSCFGSVKSNSSSFDPSTLVSEPSLELLDIFNSSTSNELLVISLVCSAGVIGCGPLVTTLND